GNLRANFSAPTIFGFSLAFVSEGRGFGNHQASIGCQIRPSFNNNIAFIVGPGQQMTVRGIAVIGPNDAYRGNLNRAGVGIGIAGGNGGASVTLIENTLVENFYTLYKTDANDACCLSDSNTFRKIDGANGYIGLHLNGTQSDINDMTGSRLANTTIAIMSDVS